jgi:hypothetical protein
MRAHDRYFDMPKGSWRRCLQTKCISWGSPIDTPPKQSLWNTLRSSCDWSCIRSNLFWTAKLGTTRNTVKILNKILNSVLAFACQRSMKSVRNLPGSVEGSETTSLPMACWLLRNSHCCWSLRYVKSIQSYALCQTFWTSETLQMSNLERLLQANHFEHSTCHKCRDHNLSPQHVCLEWTSLHMECW